MLVVCRGDVVGTLADAVPDMWFLEGTFSPGDSPGARRFAAAAAALDATEALADPTKAILASLRESPGGGDTTFIVMSLSGGRLFGRRVFDRAAIEWAEANVPE